MVSEELNGVETWLTYPIGVFLLTASFIVVLKQGDPINWAFSAVSGLLGKVDGSLTQY